MGRRAVPRGDLGRRLLCTIEEGQAVLDSEVGSRVRPSPAAIAMLVIALAFSLVVSSVAGATDTSLGATMNRWSKTIGADARSISLAARQHRPRRMMVGAAHFRRDALRARAAIGAQRASSAPGRRGKALALRAYLNYAMAGRKWAASGRASLMGRRAAARGLARSAHVFATRGNRLLITAGTLLP
jgi:hypothetical protein